MKQLELKLNKPEEIDVDGIVSRGAVLIGKAVRQFDGAWISLADVGGCLARVELKVSFK